MGFVKDLFIKGIICVEEKNVCSECFEDYAISEYVQENAVEAKCDYCSKSSEKTAIAAPLHEVVEFILEGIRYEWDDPANCVSWCSQEGGWVGATVINTYDLITDELDLGIQHDKLLADIARSIVTQEWCPSDPYGPRPDDEMIYNWKMFANQIKHHIRYVFFRASRRERKDTFDRQQPYAILHRIGEIANGLGLIKPLPSGTEFVRVRRSEKILRHTVKKLGPPPSTKAINSNKMSPSGIPKFYGSLDEKTAMAETDDKADKFKKFATVATFKTVRPFKVLDLTTLPNFPSLFDKDKRHLRTPLIFLRSFLKDFSKPIKKDGREHIEYVPTQVVTEYFRHIFRDDSRDVVRGIIYPSSRRKTGKSCVLFFENNHCAQDGVSSDSDDKWLTMMSSSVKTIRLR